MSEFEFERWLRYTVFQAKQAVQQAADNPDLSLWAVDYTEPSDDVINREEDTPDINGVTFGFEFWAVDQAHAQEQALIAEPSCSIVSAYRIDGSPRWIGALAQVNTRLRRLNTGIPVDELHEARDLFEALAAR